MAASRVPTRLAGSPGCILVFTTDRRDAQWVFDKGRYVVDGWQEFDYVHPVAGSVSRTVAAGIETDPATFLQRDYQALWRSRYRGGRRRLRRRGCCQEF